MLVRFLTVAVLFGRLRTARQAVRSRTNYLGGPHAHRIRKPDGWPLRKIGAEHMSLTVTQGSRGTSG
jgi:hypothetical protein